MNQRIKWNNDIRGQDFKYVSINKRIVYIKKQINMTGKILMRGKKVFKPMETNEDGNSFITIKDLKENFDTHPTVRLITSSGK